MEEVDDKAEFYGKDATEWLKRWDEGRLVWSLEMGGLGPGYEQAIQITAAEIIRHMLQVGYDHDKWANKKAWEKDRDAIEHWSFENAKIKGLGLTGAQWGAALNLASQIYMKGPAWVMKDDQLKDRHIMVSRSFPGA